MSGHRSVPRSLAALRHDTAATPIRTAYSATGVSLGMRINLPGTLAILEACRAVPRPPRVIFTSSVASFGGPLPETAPFLLSSLCPLGLSYSSQKLWVMISAASGAPPARRRARGNEARRTAGATFQVKTWRCRELSQGHRSRIWPVAPAWWA